MIEELAALEHNQWVRWSISLAKAEKLSEARIARWEKLWVPYEELSEEMKAEDRKEARRVLAII